MIISEEVYLGQGIDEIADFLEHHGVKGQKWGIRNKRRTNLHIKVGQGKGSPTERVRSAFDLGPIDIVKGRGFKGGAARKGVRQRTAAENIAKGKPTVRNVLTRAASVRQQDILPTSKSAHNTKAAVGSSIVAAILIGQGARIIKKAAR
jgi:hypothetical protein